jgi:MFS family permease
MPHPAHAAGNATAGIAGRTASARWALASLSLSMLMPSLDTSIANAGLPVLADAFGASFQQVQWIVLAYLLAITTLIVSVGRLGDLIGRRRLLLAGIVVFTTASIACGVASTLSLLLVARAAQGIGAAIMMVLSVALVGADTKSIAGAKAYASPADAGKDLGKFGVVLGLKKTF